MKQLSLFARKDLEEDVPLLDTIKYINSECWELFEFEQKLLASNRFSFDIETYGDLELDGLRWWQGNIRLMQFAFSAEDCYILDWMKLSNLTKQHILPAIKAALESYTIEKMAFNGKFECCFCIGQLSIHPRNFRDPMLMSQLLYGGIDYMKHNLEACCDRYLQIQLPKDEQTSDWGDPELLNKQLNYAANDALILFPLVDCLKAKVAKAGLTAQAKLECLFMHVLAEMECNGFPISFEKVEKAIAEHKELSFQKTKAFYQTFPDLSVTTPHPKMTIELNERLNIALKSTADEELSHYKDVPEVKAISDYRTIKKHIDYLKGMRENCRNGRVFTNFRQLNPKGFGRTASGKLAKKSTAVDGINLQNAPKPLPGEKITSVRSCFEVDESRSLIICDLSGAHAVFGTELSLDPVLQTVYKEGKDIHLVTATELVKMDGNSYSYEELLAAKNNKDNPLHNYVKKVRKLAKPVFYGSLNLQGVYRLTQTAASYGIFLDEETARKARKSWDNLYSDLAAKQRQLIFMANQKNETTSFSNGIYGWAVSVTGRRLWMLKYPSEYNRTGWSVKGTDCVAFHWAALEVEVTKQASVWLQNSFDKHPEWDAKIVNLCHDELNVDCFKEYGLEVAKATKQVMAKAMRKWVRSIPVETGTNYEEYIARDWSEK